ncbi:MAG: hypothetical protein Kow0042_12640 [Calditrichia bacterium]
MNPLEYGTFLWKSHRGLILFAFLFFAGMEFLIITLITTIDTAPIISAILDQLPPRLKMIFNQEFLTRFSIKGAIAFGFNHPLVLAVLSLVSITLTARHVAGEAESGTLELLLSYPLKRSRFILTLWSVLAIFLLFIVCGGWLGSILALLVYQQFGLEYLAGILKVGGNLWLLFILIMSYSLLISTFDREGGKAGTRSAAITLIFYFLHFISSIWERIDWTKPLNIFSYYLPQKLMFGERSFWVNALVLLAAISICLLGSIIQFSRRDIP